MWGTYLHAVGDYPGDQFVELDIGDNTALKSVLDELEPDLVIHCAAIARVSVCEEAPLTALETNSLATARLADLCLGRQIRLIFLSSDMVFDGSKGNYSEKDEPAPVNFYGWSKLAAEHSVARLGERGVILRVNNLYGRSAIRGDSFSEEVIQTVTEGNPYRLYADQYRSFMSVKNLAECIWEIAANDFGGLLHLGGTEPTNRLTFAHKLADQVGLDRSLLQSSSDGAGPQGLPYPKNNTFELTLARSILRTPLLDLDAGLRLEYPS